MGYNSYDDDDWTFAEVLFVIAVFCLLGFGIYWVGSLVCTPSKAETQKKDAISQCLSNGKWNKHYCELKMECVRFQKINICDDKLKETYEKEMTSLMNEVQHNINYKANTKDQEIALYAKEYAKQNGKYCAVWDDDEDRCSSVSSMPSIESIGKDIDDEIKELTSQKKRMEEAVETCKTQGKCNVYLE